MSTDDARNAQAIDGLAQRLAARAIEIRRAGEAPTPGYTPDLDAQLADREPWTLADIVREIGIGPNTAAEYALRSIHPRAGIRPDAMLPAPLPGTPVVGLLQLIRQAERSPDVNDLDWVTWAAGDIRRWALVNGRIDRDMRPIKLTPPSAALRRRTRDAR